MAGKTVYIVSEAPALRDSLAKLAASAGLRAEMLPSLQAWLDAAGPEPQGWLVLDAGAGDLVEPAGLARFASACASIPVLVLTEPGDVPMAVRAIKYGAYDVLQKPFRDSDLLERITRAVVEEGDVRA